MDRKEEIVGNSRHLSSIELNYNKRRELTERKIDCREGVLKKKDFKSNFDKFSDSELEFTEFDFFGRMKRDDCPTSQPADPVADSLKVPYRMICRLDIDFTRVGKKGVGTGFFISPRCILTAGHNVFYNGSRLKKWASKIVVTPGSFGFKRDPFGVDESYTFRSVKGYTTYRDSYFDYGVIILDSCKLYDCINTGTNKLPGGTFFDYGTISGKPKISNCGYKKGTLAKGNLHINKGFYENINGQIVEYNFDVDKGNSGGPNYIGTAKKRYKALAIHTGYPESCVTEAVKIRRKVIEKLDIWTNL